MLDYSDEDLDLWSVRKRNPSPSKVEAAGIRPGPEESLERKDEDPPLGFTTKAQSIYKTKVGRRGANFKIKAKDFYGGAFEEGHVDWGVLSGFELDVDMDWESQSGPREPKRPSFKINWEDRCSGWSPREFKKKSCKMILPTSDPPSADAFIISESIPANPFKPNNKFRNGALLLKGDERLSEQSDNFSPDGEDHPDSFYKSTRTLVLVSQFFAAFPVSGFRGPNYKSLGFKWIHYKTAYWALTLLGNIFCFVCYAARGLKEGAFEAASGIVFSASGVLSSLLMLALSRNWKDLSKEFAAVELRLRKYGYPKKIGVKFKILTVAVLLVALVEHIASKMKNFELVLICSQKNNGSFGLAKPFFLSEYSETFALSSYSLWKGILVMSAQFLITANWSLKDLFLCMISWTIAERFKQVNDLLNKVHGQDKSISFWKEVREDFNSLSVLTKRTDAYIRKLMLLSMGNNLFFICIQLFHSLNKKLDTFKLIYFFWSFGYLVLRTGCVAFSAASINDESKEPKTVLYSVPQKNYTAEVRRFLTQLTTNEIALTGSGFFSITRSLILTITGSVITYEIVLVQFGTRDTEENAQDNLTFCLGK